jgi:zinc and cadmium transporter
MNALYITIGTLVAGVGSVWIAGLLAYGWLARYTQHLLSLAAGALLATAFMHLLPEAFESQAGAQDLFTTLLCGLVFFFMLDKAELYHHGHEHHHGGDAQHGHTDADSHADGHTHAHAHGAEHAHPHDQSRKDGAHHGAKPHASHSHTSGGWAVLLGDSVHCFGDGVLIAAAYMANFQLGLAATLAVLTHEIPHHVGDLIVLRQPGRDGKKALLSLSAAGLATVVGGWLGYALLDQLSWVQPYLLAVAASSFIYVALADLIPQLQKRLSARETFAQVAWLLVGLLAITLVTRLAH